MRRGNLSWLDFYSPDWGKFLSPDDDGGNNSNGDGEDSDIDKDESLNDNQKTAMKKERALRRDAEKKARETADTLKSLQKTVDDLNADKAKRDADAAAQAEKDREAKGEFETLAKDRERERDQAKADLVEATKERDALRTAVNAVVTERFDKLPEEVRDFYAGSEDDALAKLAFLPKADKMVERLAATGSGTNENGNQEVKGNPANPKNGAAGDSKGDEAAKLENARRYG